MTTPLPDDAATAERRRRRRWGRKGEGANSKALTSQRYYKTKTKCQNPRRLCERAPRAAAAHREGGRGWRRAGRVREGDAERSLELTPSSIAASSSPSVMMAASKQCMHVCVCDRERARAQRARRSGVYWRLRLRLGLPTLKQQRRRWRNVSVVATPTSAAASRRNESKQANKQMRHQSCH